MKYDEEDKVQGKWPNWSWIKNISIACGKFSLYISLVINIILLSLINL
jgi:hypothetical protein